MKFIVYIFVLITVNGEPCDLPDGSKGNCVQIFGCPYLADLVRNEQRTEQELELLQNSSCGFEGNKPKVCCPSSCLTLEGEQGICVNRESCPHLPKNSQAKRCLAWLGSDSESICCGPSPHDNKISKEKCGIRFSAFPYPPNSNCCGTDGATEIKFSHGGGRISGTNIDQYPWMALIEYQVNNKIKLLCGGSLISGKYVLTAAHCIAGSVLSQGTPIGVRLGEYDTTKELDCNEKDPFLGDLECAPKNATITIPVESIIPHPLYDPVIKKHDIGLIRLKDLAQYSDYVRPICLPSQDYMLKQPLVFNLFVGGWGIGSSTHQSMVKTDLLLPLVKQKDCQKYFNIPQQNITLSSGQLCAGGEIGKSSCRGDTGGTLMYRGRNFEALGVMSFGSLCEREDIPTVYTNVYEYLDWIYSAITP